jgi:hypothetical protein
MPLPVSQGPGGAAAAVAVVPTSTIAVGLSSDHPWLGAEACYSPGGW